MRAAALERPAHVGRREPAAAHAQQQRAAGARDTRGRPSRSHASSASRAGSPTGTMRSRSPLPITRRRPATGVVGGELEPADLAGAQPAAVQELEHRVIAQAAHVVVPVAVEQQAAVRSRDGLGQAPAPARPDEHERRIVRRARRGARDRRTARAPTRAGGRRWRARAGARRVAPASAAAARCRRSRASSPAVRGTPHSSSRSPAQRPHRVRRVAVRDARRDEALDGGLRWGCLRRLSYKGEAFGNHASAPLNTSGGLCLR